jgi:outer membrane protein assembly factor BamB
MKHTVLMTGVVAAWFVATTPASSEENWGQWRGPSGTGVSPDGAPPVEWSEEKNIRWKRELPGDGSSSPIVWGDRVYVLTSLKTDEVGAQKEKPKAGGSDRPRGRRGRGFGGFGRKPKNIHDFVVLAIDRKTGKTVWSKSMCKALPHEGTHSTGTFASNSPICDGKNIYAYFGSRGLYCLDMKGEMQWHRDLGDMQKVMAFGEGSSPVLHGDTIVVNWDHQGSSFIVALDKKTGKNRWKIDRDESSSWATPLVVDLEGKSQVIVPGSKFSRGYNLSNGELIWKCSGLTRNTIPSPVFSNGVVYLMSGFRGNSLQAIRLRDAKGDITKKDAIVWTHNKGTPYVPSPLLYGDALYFLSGNRGLLSCFDVKTGKPHYEPQHLDAVRNVYASPVGAHDRVYIPGRSGNTLVIKRGPKYEVLAHNKLDDGFDASPAIAGSEIYLRGRKNLYCIARPE